MSPLKIIDEKQVPNTSGRNSQPALRISTGGAFNINRALAELLGITKGDKVVFAFDEEQQQYYIARLPVPSLDNNKWAGFTLRDDTTGGYNFSRAPLAQKMLALVKNMSGKASHRCPVSEVKTHQDGLEFYPVLTV